MNRAWLASHALLTAVVVLAGPYEIWRTIQGGSFGIIEASAAIFASAVPAGWIGSARERFGWAKILGNYVISALVGISLAWRYDDMTNSAADLEILGVIFFLYPIGFLTVPLGSALAGWLASRLRKPST